MCMRMHIYVSICIYMYKQACVYTYNMYVYAHMHIDNLYMCADHYKKKYPCYLYAEGNNLLRVLSYMEVDQVRTVSNNITEILQVQTLPS